MGSFMKIKAWFYIAVESLVTSNLVLHTRTGKHEYLY